MKPDFNIMPYLSKIDKSSTVFNHIADMKEIDHLFSTKFVASYELIDQYHMIIDLKIDEYYSCEDELNKIRKKYVLYGYAYLFCDGNNSYIGANLEDIEKIIDDYVGDSYHTWICDRKFSWCIEFKHDGTMLFCYSPYVKIVDALKSLAVQRR